MISRQLMVILFLPLICTTVIADQPEHEGKVLVAVYASGGSLESEYGLITEDISQMVTGASNTSPDTLEVLVAYGGSQKPGWEGMTVANLSGLAADLTDGSIGNKSDVLFFRPEADMATTDAFGDYLSWISAHYRYDRIFLILIGHGEAYTGMLFDQNHGNDPLTLTEVTEALQKGGYNVELIGFDTCLMSSLEVASAVSGYAEYMIGSEESEPAEGWRYDTFISFLAQNPDASVPDIASALFSAYLENPAPGKTLSLLRLDETGRVTASLDRFAKNLYPLLDTPEGYLALTRMFNSSQQFGLTGEGVLDPATMDLADVSRQAALMDSNLADPATDLNGSISRMVLLSVHDDAVPRAGGLAILSPVQINSGFYRYYEQEASITPSWDRFMVRYLALSDPPAFGILSGA